MDPRELGRFPYFTAKTLKAFYHDNHPEVTLTRWKRKGLIKTIEKGTYTIHDNPLTYATTIATPSYCSLRSALHHYQLTTQLPKKVQVITTRRKQELEEITFIRTKHTFGYLRTSIEGFDLFIATKEKLLLDCLHFTRHGITTDELEPLIQAGLDKDRITAYLDRTGNLNLIKRTGYLLERHGIDIHDNYKERIRKSRNYPYVDPLLPPTTRTDRKWKVHPNEARS